MIPLLIVGFARVENIAQMISEYVSTGRRIYLFIDKAETLFESENERLISFAKLLENERGIEVKIAERNLGVGRAVPTAIDWVFKTEKEVVILEDDCFLLAPHLLYFDSTISLLSGDKVMICGTTPSLGDVSLNLDEITPIRYPLIWGWATNSDSWNKLRKVYEWPILGAFREIPLSLHFRELLSTAFFFSALIRVRRASNHSWDSELAFIMLTKRYKSYVPNLSIVWNRGTDKYAHHTVTVNKSGYGAIPEPNVVISEMIETNYDRKKVRQIEKLIEENIYHLKLRNFFSPIKAILGR
jgi:hypothetical protein